MHTIIREGDENRCTRCCKRWGFDDEEPPTCEAVIHPHSPEARAKRARAWINRRKYVTRNA